MTINLLNIKPHKVSRDLSGYITFIYGAPKVGKTTLATQMEGALLLAFEKGYNALPGVMAQDITSWAEMRQVYRELKKPEVKETFKCVVVDTIDIASSMCQKYICARESIDSLGELPYGKGWTLFKEEFNEVFRGLAQLGYAVFYIGHAKKNNITDTSGNIISTQIVPSLSASSREVIAGMSDIYGYAHQKKGSETSVLTLRCSDDSIECGGRFKYIKSEIPMNYNALVETVREAIDKEALEHNNEFITNERSSSVIDKKEEYDFNAMMQQFNDYVSQLMQKEQSNATIITSIVEKYLGKGKKAGDCTPAQCEHLDLILTDLKDLLNR